MKPQSYSPTVSKELQKILLALATNNRLKIASVDIRAAFLQSRKLHRDGFMKPLPDFFKQGVILKLKKPDTTLKSPPLVLMTGDKKPKKQDFLVYIWNYFNLLLT